MSPTTAAAVRTMPATAAVPGCVRSRTNHALTTVSETTAASGRYIRRSATSSHGMGTTLELGARTMKKIAPANPAGRGAPEARGGGDDERHDDQQVRQRLGERAERRPVVVEDERVRPEAQAQVAQDRPRLRHQVRPRRDGT